MNGYIYETVNLINNKFYIGKHKGEFDPCYLGSGKLIKFALEKYGNNNFSLRIICFVNIGELNLIERRYIREHRAKYGQDMMYNISDGGDGGRPFGHDVSDSARKRIGKASSENTVNLWKDPEYRKMQSNSRKGRKVWNKGLTKETNESIARIGRINSKKRLGNIPVNKGIKGIFHHTAESKQKIGEASSNRTKNKGLFLLQH